MSTLFTGISELRTVSEAGTLADASRTDRDTAAAREADEYLRELEGASVTRLPLGSGLTLVTKL